MNKSSFASTKYEQLLANRYQIKEVIGRGGMGEVFLAEDTLLGGTPVAIKFLSPATFDDKMQKSFAREAFLSAALSQKSLHIVRAYDYGLSESGKLFYVMEYLSGTSLKDLIPVALPMFLTLVRQICLGLQSAHQGISIDGQVHPLVHRDIKPANIIVIPDPILGQLAKILDFGIAKFLNESALNSSNKGFHGTLPYCSPEQLEGEELDSRSDIYSLGVMMFEMLTGKKPWQPETDYFGAWYKAHHFEPPKAIADVRPDLSIPKPLQDLIMACLGKKPAHRPQNMAEILQILASVEQSLQPPLKPQSSGKVEKKSTSNTVSGSDLAIIIAQTCWQLTWPQDKPIQEIVFPQMIDTNFGSVAGLWLMLPKPEIKSLANTTRYNKFIYISSPHPMLLWVTVLYNREMGPKWLPCYLDMQNPHNLKLVSALADNERYPLIFFTLEPPHGCANVLSCTIAPTYRQRLKIWVKQSQELPPANQALASKQMLKQQYKQIQAEILQHLETQLI
ncbi:MAG TPA: serine/threonine-protein kinase [Nostocaceae cyanobacterium]|nr:serine/threonine-protein kinase [Nostocaceae cyanobacterium]